MLDLGIGTAASAVRQRGGGAAPQPAPASPLTEVRADGWSATYPNPPAFQPDSAPERVTLSRAGFDASGQPVTVPEQLVITARVRQPYPNQGLASADRAALSDYVYATDAIAGVANGSGEVSPKPIANWIMPARLAVANTIRLEVIAAHRNARAGRQVAAVKFIATDGATTVSQVVAETVISGRTGDRNPVVCFQCDLDVSTLQAGLVTVNAEVYPWIGGAASVNKSADNVVASSGGTVGREFSPRYFLKSMGAKTLYYVKTAANGGNDATGAGSSDAAAASATPFLTVLAAINKAHADLGATSGVDMAEIRIGDDGGTPFVLTSTSAIRTQKVAALTITRDPAVAKANARVSFGAAAFRPRLGGGFVAPVATGALRFSDMAVVRTGTGTFQGEAAPAQLELIFDNVDFDAGGFVASWLSNSHDHHYGTVFTNLPASSNALGASTFEHRIWRGVRADTAHFSLEGWLVVGSDISRPGHFGRGTRLFSGAIFACNTLRNPAAGSAVMLHLGQDADVNGAALLQNEIEFTSATAVAVLRISGDSDTGSNSHVVIHGNTFAGFHANGRGNLFYDEGATPRTSKLMSLKGNIHVQINTKGDVFVADGSRQGNWAYLYGVGCEGEFSQFIDANNGGLGTSFAQAYPGLKAKIGTSASVRNDPLFTDYRGTTAGPTAGAGGGTYTLQAGSPAKAMLGTPVLSHTLGGIARAAVSDGTGAYA